MFHQNWLDAERCCSSTYRELSAVLLSLESSSKELTSQTIAWFMGNQSVLSIIEKGSNISDLQEIATKIFDRCAVIAIILKPQ